MHLPHDITAILGNIFGPSLIVLSVLTAAELLLPKERQSPSGRIAGIAFWIVYIPAATLIGEGFHMLWQAIGVKPLFVFRFDFTWMGLLNVLAAPIVGAMLYDFFFYFYHRAQHRWLWRQHAVHHSIRDLNAVNSYHHISEPVLQAVFLILPATLLYCDTGMTVPVMAVLVRLHASWIHSPTRFNLGPLRAVICDNRFHRIHHSLETAHFDKNFGAFTTLWDRLFGTAVFPEHHDWPATGLADVPQPTSIRTWLMLPLRLK